MSKSKEIGVCECSEEHDFMDGENVVNFQARRSALGGKLCKSEWKGQSEVPVGTAADVISFAKEKASVESRREEQFRDECFEKFREKISLVLEHLGYTSRRELLAYVSSKHKGYRVEPYSDECLFRRFQELLAEVKRGDCLFITSGLKDFANWNCDLSDGLKFLLDLGVEIYFCASPIVDGSYEYGISPISEFSRHENFHFFVRESLIDEGAAVVVPSVEAVSSGKRRIEAVTTFSGEELKERRDYIALLNSSTDVGRDYLRSLFLQIEKSYRIDGKVDHLMALTRMAICGFCNFFQHPFFTKKEVVAVLESRLEFVGQSQFHPCEYPRILIENEGNVEVLRDKAKEVKEILMGK